MSNYYKQKLLDRRASLSASIANLEKIIFDKKNNSQNDSSQNNDILRCENQELRAKISQLKNNSREIINNIEFDLEKIKSIINQNNRPILQPAFDCELGEESSAKDANILKHIAASDQEDSTEQLTPKAGLGKESN